MVRKQMKWGQKGQIGNSLLDDLELLHQYSSKFLDEMRSVASFLELDDDRLNNFVFDALHINHLGRRRFVVVGIGHLDGSPVATRRRRRWRVFELDGAVTLLGWGRRTKVFVGTFTLAMRSF